MNKPSNPREQFAFERGWQKAYVLSVYQSGRERTAELRDQRNPHKKNSTYWHWWNKGFDSV